MTAPTPVLARRQVRVAAMAALGALTDVTLESPPVTATAPKQLPHVGVRCGTERKAAEGKRLPKFTTTATIEVIARVSASTKEAAQDALEALAARIEAALFGSVDLIALVQKMDVTTTTEISGEGSTYLAGVEMSIDCELYEVFDPVLLNPDDYPALQGVNLHVDTARPFDANGIYAASPFPDSVTPAPRTSGPDGRDEIAANIDLPT
jgi:hypothetical protein